MPIGIDDLDDDDILEVQEQPTEVEETIQTSSTEPPSEGDFMSDFLKTKGIEDINRIKFEDENGNIEERSWNSLSRDEQFNILNTPISQPQETQDLGLSNEEIELLNQIRSSNMSPQEFISQYQAQEQEPVYKVDDLTDDEIFLLDLESRVGEITDDEAAQALAVSKQNEDLYKKQVEGIRKEYKEREEQMNEQLKQQQEEEQRNIFNEYSKAVVDSIDNFNSIGNLDLNFENSDKEELAEFMLSQDETGSNYLYKALQDPNTLVRAAWFILNGEEAFNNISDYFTNQIKLVSENQYRKGLEDGRKGIESRPQVVIQKNNQSSSKRYKDINDLDDED